MPSERSPRPTPGKRLGLVLAGLAGAVVLSEGVVRLGLIRPARQIIRGNNLRTLHGVPVWEPEPERQHIDCATRYPHRTRVAFYGNSVTFGTGVEAAQTFASLLEERLNRLHPDPGYCVMNFAVPAFRFAQKFATAEETLPRYRPTLAFYQDWDMEWGGVRCAPSGDYPVEYVRLGDSVFTAMEMRLRPDGIPGIGGVPDPLNHFLFSHFYLYQYLTMAEGEPRPPTPPCPSEDPPGFRVYSLRRFTALARSVGARPLFYLAADLTYPLNETHPDEVTTEQPLVDMGRDDGVPVIKLRDLLRDQDNTAIRLDGWHYNPRGHQVLAARFERVVLDALAPHPGAAP